MRAASVAVPTLMIALVLMPAMMAGDAIGTVTSESLAIGGSPIASAASLSGRGMDVRPVNVFRTIGKRLYTKSATKAGSTPIPGNVPAWSACSAIAVASASWPGHAIAVT